MFLLLRGELKAAQKCNRTEGTKITKISLYQNSILKRAENTHLFQLQTAS